MAELTYKRQTHVYELEGGVKIELRMSPIDGTVTIGFAARDDFSPYLFLKYDEFHIAHLGFDTTADNASVADKGLRHKISAGEENVTNG